MLTVDVDFLTGVSVSTRWGTLDQPEWPPHPSRLFRAFVAAAADGDLNDAEVSALKILEALGPPEIRFPAADDEHVRSGTDIVFVPPNDAGVSGRLGAALPKGAALKAANYLIPAYRTNKQARAFPALALSDDARIVRYIWPVAEVSPADQTILAAIAKRVSYVGHSHSLTRVHVTGLDAAFAAEYTASIHVRPSDEAGAVPLGVPAPGEFDRCRIAYDSRRRPGAGAIATYALVSDASARHTSSAFSQQWIVLQSLDRRAPLMTAVPYIADILRRTLIKYADSLPTSEHFPLALKHGTLDLISGHARDGSVSTVAHLAIVPLARLGDQYADGQLHGLALVPPQLASVAEAEIFDDVLRACLADASDSDGRISLTLGERFGLWHLQEMTSQPPLFTLDVSRYCTASTTWTTATPIVLDRHPKKDGDTEAIIQRACTHVGLPAPTVLPHKHCALTGGVAAWSSVREGGNTQRWARRWGPPNGTKDVFAGRPLTHATLQFPVPVAGPLLLGAGRYLGLGLCVPISEPSAQ
jgi:CRISPR-associated protein Csb2